MQQAAGCQQTVVDRVFVVAEGRVSAVRGRGRVELDKGLAVWGMGR